MNAALALSPSHPVFSPSPRAGVPECFIATARPGQRVMVAVHRISRNAAEIATRFAIHPAFAEVTIVAPLFTREDYGQYQQLEVRKVGRTRSDTGLLALLDDLAARHGIVAGRFSLFGFSGVVQMAHRGHVHRFVRMVLPAAYRSRLALMALVTQTAWRW